MWTCFHSFFQISQIKSIRGMKKEQTNLDESVKPVFDQQGYVEKKFKEKLDNYNKQLKAVDEFNAMLDGKARTWFRAVHGLTGDQIKWDTRRVSDNEVTYQATTKTSYYGDKYSMPLEFFWKKSVMESHKKALQDRRDLEEKWKTDKERAMYEQLKEKYG